MKPEIQKVLRASGLDNSIENDDSTISDKLNRAGLGTEQIADELSLLARSTNNESLKLRALETAMKAHGVLKESAPQVPSFTLVIQSNSETQVTSKYNLPAGVNPILLPRQLLKDLIN